MRTKIGAKYKRVSTKKQFQDDRNERREDGSLEMQDSRIMRRLELKSTSKLSYQVEYDVEDAGKSAKDTKRKGFQSLLSLIKRRKIDFVIATDISRLSRSVLDFLNFVTLCKDHDVEIILINQEMDTSTPAGNFALGMMALLAEFEREQTSTRQRNNLRERLFTGGKINGVSELLGLDKDKKRAGHFKVNPEEVRVLEKILTIFLESTGRADALRKIQSQGIKYKKGKELTRGRFDLLIKNVEWRYDGKWYFKDEEEEGKLHEIPLDHGPLISNELRDAVLKKVVESKRNTLRKGKNKIIYLLSGILVDKKGNKYCGEYSKGRSKHYRYYRGKKNSPRVEADLIESTVENRVIEYFTNNHLFENLVLKTLQQTDAKIPQINADLRLLGRKSSELKDKRSILVSRIADTTLSLSKEAIGAISNELAEIERERESIEEKIKSLQGFRDGYKNAIDTTDAKKAVKQYAERFRSLSKVSKRKLIEQIFEKIEVLNPYSIKLHIKKAPKEGLFLTTVTNGSSSDKNGGACWT